MTENEQAMQSANDAMWKAWARYMAIEDTPGASREAIDNAREEYRKVRSLAFGTILEARP